MPGPASLHLPTPNSETFIIVISIYFGEPLEVNHSLITNPYIFVESHMFFLVQLSSLIGNHSCYIQNIQHCRK